MSEGLCDMIRYLFGVVKFLITFNVRKVAYYTQDYSTCLLRDYDAYIQTYKNDADPIIDDTVDADINLDARVEPCSTQEPVLIENLPEVK
jgi:hypothetical protein